MLTSTLPKLRCPYPRGKSTCGGEFELKSTSGKKPVAGAGSDVSEIEWGTLVCRKCRARFPILAGVAVVVPDVGGYLTEHVKGISSSVPDDAIPAEYRDDYLAAKEEIETGHIEEDLEAERVNALYLMNHYLRADRGPRWWEPQSGAQAQSPVSAAPGAPQAAPGQQHAAAALQASPLVAKLIEQHWDQGPFSVIEGWLSPGAAQPLAQSARPPSALPGGRTATLPNGRPAALPNGRPATVELGCGVGGLEPRLRPFLSSYLGVDSSFASIARARHLALGFAWKGSHRIPEDLLQGPVSRKIDLPPGQPNAGASDFIVGDLALPPLAPGLWDLSIALNAIDMLDEPSDLPEVQALLVRSGGQVIQSCPYIWHEAVARKLRKRLPKGVRGSAAAAEWLYEQAGFQVEKRQDHVPWLFYKHLRQLEIYSVHLFQAVKNS